MHDMGGLGSFLKTVEAGRFLGSRGGALGLTPAGSQQHVAEPERRPGVRLSAAPRAA